MQQSPALRVGDRERERVAEALRQHAAAGRLDPDELETRLEQAYAARTGADLAPLTADLPALDAEPPRPPHRQLPALPAVLVTWLTVNLVALAVWVASGDAADRGWDEFWPKWVFIVSTIVLVRKLTRAHRS